MGLIIYAISVFPNYPTDLNSYGYILVLAAPGALLYFVLEHLGQKIFWENRLAASLQERTKHKKLSCLRLVYGFVVAILAITIVVGLGIIIND